MCIPGISVVGKCWLVAHLLPSVFRAPTWILDFLSAFFCWPSLYGTAAGLIDDAKTACMHQANMQAQNHLGHSCCLVEVSVYSGCYCLRGLLFIPWAQTCSKAARRSRFIRSLDRTWKRSRSRLEREKRTWRTPLERDGPEGTYTIRYDTIGEFNVDWKAEYSALSSTRSQKKKLKQPTPVPL